VVTIAHISDPHVGSPYFVPNLMNRVISELNELAPDLIVCTGDLTNEGYRQEYKNWVAYAERLDARYEKFRRMGRLGQDFADEASS
jgi:3',5'-cyclic AMP phosphodiesterase CpdA